ncbi:hypothetical protein K431DRAFT_283515 [Polychaeton citri CBS 116435]|uniref:Uncharacterized protein n=1 Tax=Polychaeton citri CBS 116435 TaxID=1314669 RepID=A0A9P4QDP8_9PEZI|nr:hypothetical protein K431DRAFT_283515 [Polychaeton citri CBS 116435]
MCCLLLTTAIAILFASFAIALDWNPVDAGARGVTRVDISLPCRGCLTGQPADEALVFDFALLDPALDGTEQFALNAKWEPFPAICDDDSHPSSHCGSPSFNRSVSLSNNRRTVLDTDKETPAPLAFYSLGVSVQDEAGPGADTSTPQRHLSFHFDSVDSNQLTQGVGFVVVITPEREPRILDILPEPSQSAEDPLPGTDWPSMGKSEQGSARQPLLDLIDTESPDFNVDLAIDELQSLEQQLAVQRGRIAQYLHKDASSAELRHLLQTCDGLICKVSILFNHMCSFTDRKMVPGRRSSRITYPTAEAISKQSLLQVDELEIADSPPPYSEAGHDGRLHPVSTAEPVEMPLRITQSASVAAISSLELPSPTNPVVILIECVAALLGLIVLFRVIQKRCMSLRKRVEREADREERRNARAYRRAARRAYWRKRWQKFVAAVSCCSSGDDDDTTSMDYDEKRALILQDAFIENLADLDAAEKGELMDAEIRELRYANDIVATLVRNVGGMRHVDVAWPASDPPPSVIPLPRTPEPRSRASTQTLPSYTTSEGLPDYTSTAPTSDETSIFSRGTTLPYVPHYTHEPHGYYSPVDANSTGRTRYTPNSSIIEVSPRASAETLRTRFSKDSEPVNFATRDL